MNDQKLQARTDLINRSKRRSFLKGALAGGLVGGLLVVGITVQAHGLQRAQLVGAMGDPAAMAERIQFGAEFMLAKVGASDQQKAEVRDILHGAATDLAPLGRQHRANRDAMRAALAAPAIDKAALDKLRVDELRLADQASVRIQRAVLATADVLTPEQRRSLLDRIDERRQQRRQS